MIAILFWRPNLFISVLIQNRPFFCLWCHCKSITHLSIRTRLLLSFKINNLAVYIYIVYHIKVSWLIMFYCRITSSRMNPLWTNQRLNSPLCGIQTLAILGKPRFIINTWLLQIRAVKLIRNRCAFLFMVLLFIDLSWGIYCKVNCIIHCLRILNKWRLLCGLPIHLTIFIERLWYFCVVGFIGDLCGVVSIGGPK